MLLSPPFFISKFFSVFSTFLTKPGSITPLLLDVLLLFAFCYLLLLLSTLTIFCMFCCSFVLLPEVLSLAVKFIASSLLL